MLRAIPDRELAREAARLNVSALAAGQARLVERGETRTSMELLRNVIERGTDDLDGIRRALRATPERAPTRVFPVRGRDVGRER